MAESTISETQRIAAELQRMYEGPAWHGPSVLDSLRELSASQASVRPMPNTHSIYELTHHLGVWIGEVHSRLNGNPPGQPAEGDFPAPDTAVNEAAWRRVLARLDAHHANLLATLSTFDSNRLNEAVDPAAPPAQRQTFYVLLHGLVQHNAYHAGQIMLLRRGIGA
jgi:uncharacterized damage-inducible protein DinB